MTLVVASDATSLRGNALEDIVDKGVHDGHGTLADASVGVDVTENLEDVGVQMFFLRIFTAKMARKMS